MFFPVSHFMRNSLFWILDILLDQHYDIDILSNWGSALTVSRVNVTLNNVFVFPDSNKTLVNNSLNKV